MIVLVHLLIYSSAFAQVPQKFNYQAVCRDNMGSVIANQSIDFRLTIHDLIPTGTIVYQELQSTTTNILGLVTLEIGGGTVQSGIFNNIPWSTGNKFLEVEMDLGSGFISVGTSQLLSVPYALYAQNSGNVDTLWIRNGTNIYNSNQGNVGVGINNPIGRMVVQGSATAEDTIPLFEVKNKQGHTIFVVYPDSVHIYVKDGGSKSNRGGFAVSGRSNAKNLTNDFLRVSPDSTRIWTGDTIAGFGVRNIGATSKTSYMQLTPKNYFIGHEAGKSITIGKYNSFIGYESGYKDTSGYKNYFIGYRAGYNNSNGYSNVFMGDSAGFSNTVGYHNVFIGNQSGLSNTDGFKNIAIGNGSFHSNTSGMSDIAIGDEALSHNTFGYFNIAIGRYSLWQNTTGSINTAIGNGALMNNTTAHYNTAFGGACLLYLDNGNGNTAVGALALQSITFGINNTALGYHSFQTSDPIGNSTALGAEAQINLSNKVRIGDATVQIIEGQVAYSFPSDGRFKNNVTEEVKGLDFITRLRPIVYNFDTKKFDEFLMKDMPDSTKKSIMSKKDYSESTNIRQTGFIAQEIEQAAKESGYDFNGVHKPANEKDNYSVSYSLFTVPLVKAVQEQQVMINNLKHENQNLLKLIETQNSQMKAQNDQINKLNEQVLKIQKSLSVSGKN